MVLVVRPFSGRTARQPNNSAKERNQQGLEQEREDHVPGGEADGAHGGDFAATFGDRGVHGVERAENRANGHDRGNESTQHGDELGHGGGLLGVVVNFAIDVDIHARIGSDSVLELLKSGGRSQMNGGGLKDIGRAFEDFVEDLGVAPDFGVESGAARVKDADNFPMAAGKINFVADGEARSRFSRRSCRRRVRSRRVGTCGLARFSRICGSRERWEKRRESAHWHRCRC